MLMLLALLSCAGKAGAQTVAVKSDLLTGGMLASPNLGVELKLSERFTLEAGVYYNPFPAGGDKRWKHWFVQPGVRYWFCDRMAGHFVGMHLHGGKYNIGGWDGHVKFLNTDFRRLKDSRFQGWFAGAGISYGYSWILGKHWNIEAEIGFGWAYTRYDRFECAGCGRKVESDRVHNYVGPTKAAINMVYVF